MKQLATSTCTRYNEIAKLVFTGLRVFSQKALNVRKMLRNMMMTMPILEDDFR